MQLGNPSGATADPADHHHFLIQRTVEAMDYSDTLGEANWVSWNLTGADIGASGRSSFSADPDLPLGFAAIDTGDYTGSGYDRGHLCPSGERTVSVSDNDPVFYMSNHPPPRRPTITRGSGPASKPIAAPWRKRATNGSSPGAPAASTAPNCR